MLNINKRHKHLQSVNGEGVNICGEEIQEMTN